MAVAGRAHAQSIELPRVVEQAQPRYPSDAGGRARDVRVVVTIDAQGRPKDARVVEPAGDSLEEAARDAAMRTRFAPATRVGKPIASKITMRIPVRPPAATATPIPTATPTSTQTSTVEDVEVRGERASPSPTKFAIDQREIATIPGTGGDALRTVESLPGVARAPAFSGLIIMRGSAPQDSQVFVDGASVPLAFHFGGLAAIVPTETIERLDVYPGNYDVEYGRGLGGIVDVGLKSPERDRVHALAKLDLLDGRAVVQGPIDAKTRVLVAARRSWFDVWFPAVAPTLGAGVTASPVYWDGQAIVERDLGGTARARASLLTSADRLSVTLPSDTSDPAFTGALHDAISFWRAMLRADGGSASGTRWLTSASFGHDTLALGLGNLRASDDAWRATGRAQVDAPIASWARARAGLDVQAGWYSLDVVLPPVPTPDEPDTGPIFGRSPLHQTRSDSYLDPGAFVAFDVRPNDRWRILPGLRAEAFSGVPGVALQPRANVRYRVSDARDPRPTWLKAAAGLYAQKPQPYENDPVFGTPGIGFERALQVSGGVEQTLSRHVTLSVEPFYKWLWDLTSRRADASSDSGFRYGNEGVGWVAGTELLVKYTPDDRFFGWIAYTISRSQRRALPEQPWRVFEFDQTHVLSALGSLRLGRGWEVGARVRYVTGNPFTPVVGGAFDADAGAYTPIERLPLFGGRVPPFWQVDVRGEKKWMISAQASVAAYLDVINVSNHRNPEGITTNFDSSQQGRVSGLPIIPVLGLRGEL